MKESRQLTGYKQALLDAKKEIEDLTHRYGSIKPKDSYAETFQDARLMGYKDAIYKINKLIEKYESEEHKYPGFDKLDDAADNYIGHPKEVDEGINVSMNREAFKAGADWQRKEDFDFFTGQMNPYDPNMEISDEEKLEALRYAYDLDAYMEGQGPCVADVVNGYYGGLTAQKKKDKIDFMVYPLLDTTKYKIDTYIANNFITDKIVKTDVNAIVHAMKEGVRLGREEYKNDIMKEAVDGYISVGGKRRLISILDRMKKFKYGDKIKAIIIKDE